MRSRSAVKQQVVAKMDRFLLLTNSPRLTLTCDLNKSVSNTKGLSRMGSVPHDQAMLFDNFKDMAFAGLA
jgi:hypothetical protein